MEEYDVCERDRILSSREEEQRPDLELRLSLGDVPNGNVELQSGGYTNQTNGEYPSLPIDMDALLSLFGGNLDNLEYYSQIRGVALGWNEEERERLVCDPRDSEKWRQVGSWRPLSGKVKNIHQLLEQCKAGEEVGFRSKQTAVVGEESDGDGGDNSCRFCCNDDTEVSIDDQSFQCGVQGCGDTFVSLALYEAHYQRCHNYTCASCRRSFVSSFLLDIHVEENHDSYFQLLSARVDMYRCLVEACDQKFQSADMRKDHMVKGHNFPTSFSFHRPLKKDKFSRSALDNAMDITEPPELNPSKKDDCIESVNGKTSQVKTNGRKLMKQGVPMAICFGRGSSRGFQWQGLGGRGRHWYQTARPPDADTGVDIESLDMTELVDSLS